MRQQKITDILTFLQRSKGLELVERYNASLKGMRNTVAGHSWRLALMTLVIATECKVNVDLNRAMSLALIHDLAEAKTGDVDAYTHISAESTDKEIKEDEAIRSMTDGVSFGDWIYSLWREYEDQASVEAKFVCALDKIEGFLHIAEDGVDMYVPKEFHATYADNAVAAFDEATRHFPELKDLLEAIKKDLQSQFERVGVKWIDGSAETSLAVKE